MSPPSAPPSAQEIHRKLSGHSVPKSSKALGTAIEGAITGAESDSDSTMFSGSMIPPGSLPQPLSSIAERDLGSGEDSDEEDEEEGGWRSANVKEDTQEALDEGLLKSGYLWKKGKRRKSWKKRWFVLRSAHLAYYKTSAEYQLLRLLQLSDVHSCTPITLKKHENTFGLISPIRTYYLQAKTSEDVQDWVQAIEDARNLLIASLTQSSPTIPIPIPTTARSASLHAPFSTPPPVTRMPLYNLTSSDSDDPSPFNHITCPPHLQETPAVSSSQKKLSGGLTGDSGKVILSGYLMKCGSKRRNWRKRWFTLTAETLAYSGSHMHTKSHRQFVFSQILDAFEYDLPSSRYNATLSSTPATVGTSPGSDAEDPYATHTFKIVTTKRTLLLCAPTEEDEIKWLGAIRALIARRSTLSGDSIPHGAAPLVSETGITAVTPGL